MNVLTGKSPNEMFDDISSFDFLDRDEAHSL